MRNRITNQTTPVRTFASTRIPLSSQPSILFNQPNVRTTRFEGNGLNTIQAYGRAQSMTDSSTDNVVSASGELDAARYGGILKSRGLVGLRGAGTTYDGFYYVQSATHSITRGEYKQRFSLTREAAGSISPAVIP